MIFLQLLGVLMVQVFCLFITLKCPQMSTRNPLYPSPLLHSSTLFFSGFSLPLSRYLHSSLTFTLGDITIGAIKPGVLQSITGEISGINSYYGNTLSFYIAAGALLSSTSRYTGIKN